MNTYAKLQELARNMWWSWNPEVLDLFRRLDESTLRAFRNNPIAVLKAIDASSIRDERLISDVDLVYDAFQEYMNQVGQYAEAPRTNYFCMEYGLHESLPIYSGGLGVLAGDHAKAASDIGLPFTAVGLLLSEGYFKQHFSEDGWQHETFPAVDETLHPLELVRRPDGEVLMVTVHSGERLLHLRGWQLDLGRTRLYLLDSNFDHNDGDLRPLTRRLYQGDRRMRLRQEIVLGIGGIRFLRALGIEADVYHMNEGHCAFVPLELLRERLATGQGRQEAETWVREQCVFTTHTPVLAGHDRFDPQLFLEEMSRFRGELQMSEYDILRYGRVHPDDMNESFTMTVLGLKLSRQANGVSRLNGEVAREQWYSLYPDRRVHDVPIGHITNGVHLATWAAPVARAFLNEKLGNWKAHTNDPEFWAKIAEIDDEVLWRYRSELRKLFVDYANAKSTHQSLPISSRLDPEALTIGFARRFATYKRAPLLFRDLSRVADLFSRSDRPVQIVYAGKAHPADEGGKRFIQRIIEASRHPKLSGRVVFLENYEIEIGRMLVSGCDVWLNNPRRPMEASGTSGQKVAIHGGLNLSIPDGWWPEGHDGSNGWMIGSEDAEGLNPDEQDRRDAENLYALLENDVIPEFYERNERGIPARWVARMRRAMMTLPPQFSARRMLIEYVEQMYKVGASSTASV